MGNNTIASIKGEYASVNGTQIYYEIAGEGHPLILIHGGQLDRRMWDDQFPVFARYCQVVRYDVRDHGLSNSKCPPGAYSDHEDLLGLLQHLGISKAAIMGLSLGGIIAIEFTLTCSDRVSALLPISSGLGGYNSPSEQATTNTNKMIEAWEQGDMESVVEFFQHSWTDGPYRKPTQVNPIVRNRVRVMALERVKQGPSAGERQPLMPPAMNRLGEIHIPTLTILGELDMPDMFAISEILFKEINGSERISMAGVAHMVNMEQPAEFNEIVLDFLRRVKIMK